MHVKTANRTGMSIAETIISTSNRPQVAKLWQGASRVPLPQMVVHGWCFLGYPCSAAL